MAIKNALELKNKGNQTAKGVSLNTTINFKLSASRKFLKYLNRLRNYNGNSKLDLFTSKFQQTSIWAQSYF